MNIRYCYLFPLIVFLVYLNSATLIAQISPRNNYNLLLEELKILRNYEQSQATSHALEDSAKHYASQNEYVIAVIFLEEILSTLADSNPVANTLPIIDNFAPEYNLIIRTGLDYNRQEFELGYISADSILIDEIGKPFVGINYQQALAGAIEDGLSIRTDFRYDKENTLLSGHLQYHSFSPGIKTSLDAGILYDKNDLYKDLGYLELNSHQSLDWSFSNSWSAQVRNILRYKQYDQPSATVPNFIRNELNTTVYYIHSTAAQYYLNYNLDINESQSFDHNDYTTHTSNLSANLRPSQPILLTGDIGLRFHDFKYNQGLEDSILANTALAYFADLNLNIFFTPQFRWRTSYRPKVKNYQVKTEQEPDYNYHDILSTLGFSFATDFSVELGYRYESKQHDNYEGAEEAYILEQNYHGHGVVFGTDFSNYQGYFISISGSYSWRRYPDALVQDVFRIYSNKNVLSLYLIGQLPFNNNLSLNVFASYDSDQDLDTDENNTRSSIYSVELQYKF